MEISASTTLRHAACTRPPKRSTQIAGHAGPSDVLRFPSDQRGFGNCRMPVELAEEGVAVGPMAGNLFPSCDIRRGPFYGRK